MVDYVCVVLPETVCSRRKAKSPTKKTGKVKRDWRKTSTLGTPEHKEMKDHSTKQTRVQMMCMRVHYTTPVCMKLEWSLNQRGSANDMNTVKPMLKMLRPESTSACWK